VIALAVDRELVNISLELKKKKNKIGKSIQYPSFGRTLKYFLFRENEDINLGLM
jgi:hypothetical protein